MMTMVVSPYRRLANLRSLMDRMVEETYDEAAQSEREMVLAVDVQASDEAYSLTALVPGLEAINYPIGMMGQMAARLVLRDVHGTGGLEIQNRFEPSLVQRASIMEFAW